MKTLCSLAMIVGLLGTVTPYEYATNKQCWTDWLDRDDPYGSGDWELLANLIQEYPQLVCDHPQDIQAQTLTGLTPAQAGDTVEINKNKGFVCKNADQEDHMCNDYHVRFSCHPPFCGDYVCWTDWFNQDTPSGPGDFETLSKLQNANPGKICEKPMYIEVVTVDDDQPAISTGQKFQTFNPTEGFVCRNDKQSCLDYKVRFGCYC